MQAAHTLPMTVPTQDDVGWTWLSHHGIAPAPPRRTPTPGRRAAGRGRSDAVVDPEVIQCSFRATGTRGGVTADGWCSLTRSWRRDGTRTTCT